MSSDCEVTATLREDNVRYITHGEEDAEGNAMFGWVEKDGELGDDIGATSDEEKIYVGDSVQAGVVINVNPCYRWSASSSAVSISP